MVDLNEAFAEGYEDAASDHGINLNPYELDTPEWIAYEEGFMECLNDSINETANMRGSDYFGA